MSCDDSASQDPDCHAPSNNVAARSVQVSSLDLASIVFSEAKFTPNPVAHRWHISSGTNRMLLCFTTSSPKSEHTELPERSTWARAAWRGLAGMLWTQCSTLCILNKYSLRWRCHWVGCPKFAPCLTDRHPLFWTHTLFPLGTLVSFCLYKDTSCIGFGFIPATKCCLNSTNPPLKLNHTLKDIRRWFW